MKIICSFGMEYYLALKNGVLTNLYKGVAWKLSIMTIYSDVTNNDI
ncbi:hypothetical protein [Clostridium diolis]|jgi:hypothetical protein|nr:hypothetical protein [Clostridium diolis]